jgi:hypothetical protein
MAVCLVKGLVRARYGARLAPRPASQAPPSCAGIGIRRPSDRPEANWLPVAGRCLLAACAALPVVLLHPRAGHAAAAPDIRRSPAPTHWSWYGRRPIVANRTGDPVASRCCTKAIGSCPRKDPLTVRANLPTLSTPARGKFRSTACRAACCRTSMICVTHDPPSSAETQAYWEKSGNRGIMMAFAGHDVRRSRRASAAPGWSAASRPAGAST